MKKIIAIHRRFLEALELVSGVLVAVVTLMVCSDVFLRYFLNSPTIWVVPLSSIFVLLVTLCGAVWLLEGDKHIKIDIVVARLHGKSKLWVDTGVDISCAACSLILAWASAQSAWSAMVRDVPIEGAVSIPKYIPLGAIAFGFFLMFIGFLKKQYSPADRGRQD